MTHNPQPASTPINIEEYYRNYHQHQGPTTHCADFSISMVCNIYYDKKIESASRCEVGKITAFLDRYFFLGCRFPSKEGRTEGGATPVGIIAALLDLRIPFSFNLFGSLGFVENALKSNKIIIASLGKLFGSKSGPWGHVMVIVGMEGNYFLLLDPAQQAGSGVTRLDKEFFLSKWWHRPFRPCWVIQYNFG